MVSLDDITVSWGGFTLLDKVSFHIDDMDKIGLVGKNGAGKTTLMRIICGEQPPTSGRVDRPQSIRIGYLPQIMKHSSGRTVLEEAMTAFEGIHGMEREMEGISAALSERTDYESKEYLSLIARYNELSDLLSMEASDPPAVQAQKTLLGLGFRDSDFDKPTKTFSQGWNMRIELAKILLSKPDLMLLDEPTNHLDIESIEWLEDYLKSYRGAILLVSHDRRFLDNVTGRTVEILLSHIHDYKVPYSKYVVLREERMAQQLSAYENQQRMIEKTEDFIARFRYKPTKSNQVQSRIKALERLERIEVDETDSATLRVKFPPAPRSGDVVFGARDITVGYPGKVVFSHADIELRRGEKVALVGRNGEGKTTLMRVVMGELAPFSGEAKVGYNVSIGYYAQNQEDVLDPEETVLSTLERIAVGDIRMKLRDILAQFLFRGTDIDKKVKVLSGGERARLAMARLMLQPYNLLALDEPTNHMDIKSKEILKQALQAYDGTLLVVSHDRDFLDGLVGKLYEFRDGKVKEQLGGVSDFLERRKILSLQELERRFGANVKAPVSAEAPAGTKAGGVASSPEAKASSSPQDPKASFEKRKAQSREERKTRLRVEYLEKEIGKLEKRQGEIEKILSGPAPGDDVMELTREYLENKRALDSMTDEWGSLI